MQFTRVNSNPDETNGLLGVIDKVGLTIRNKKIKTLTLELHCFLAKTFLRSTGQRLQHKNKKLSASFQFLFKWR
jgi:hypothetical protein